MKQKLTSALRVAALLTLATVAMAGIFSTPVESSPSWLADFLEAKAAGFGAAAAAVGLYRHWAKKDPAFSGYDRMMAD